jgi:regulator of sigma E protease
MITFLYVLLAIVLLGVLITVHEYGHFTAARLTGIAVKEYSVGLGPKLLQWKSKKHETLFTLRLIPMGGYCMFYGDETDQENADDPRAFDKAKVWKRIVTVFSGPLMNMVLAFVLAIVLEAGYGLAIAQPFIAQVEASMPAATAGLEAGDVLEAVNGQTIAEGDASALSEAIAGIDAGETFILTILRGDETKDIELAPVWDDETQSNRIGITIQAYGPIAAGQIVPAAWDGCVYASTAILDALGKLVTTGEGAQDAAGPVGVVQLVAEETQKGGMEIFLNLAVLISINLGLFNLLPIPGLDGSRLVFMLIEAVRRKPINRKIEATVHLVGYALLFGLMVFFTFRDVGRIITG